MHYKQKRLFIYNASVQHCNGLEIMLFPGTLSQQRFCIAHDDIEVCSSNDRNRICLALHENVLY